MVFNDVGKSEETEALEITCERALCTFTGNFSLLIVLCWQHFYDKFFFTWNADVKDVSLSNAKNVHYLFIKLVILN